MPRARSVACACGAEAVEGVDDAPDRSEEADEGGDVGDGSEPGEALLHDGEGFAGGGGGGALEADRIAGEAAARWFCRWYSSLISMKTGTSGDGRNCSEMAATSERRPERRKARMNFADCERAEAKALYFAMMTDQEKRLRAASRMRTAKATGPELWMISPMAEECCAHGRGGSSRDCGWSGG